MSEAMRLSRAEFNKLDYAQKCCAVAGLVGFFAVAFKDDAEFEAPHRGMKTVITGTDIACRVVRKLTSAEAEAVRLAAGAKRLHAPGYTAWRVELI